MPDDFENVSVEGTAVEPVVGATEPVADPVDTPTEGAPSDISSDERVLQDTSGNDKTYEDYAKRQVAQEQGHAIDAPDNGRAPLTEASRQKKTDAEEERKSQFFEVQQQAENLRKEKENNFGMSSHDLTRLIDFISSPDLKKKLEERLTSSIGEKKAKKAMAELDEFTKLKKKQDSGEPLTDVEKARMAELRKSEDLKAAIQSAHDMRNERDLATGGAISKEIGQDVEVTESSTEEAKVKSQKLASFESSVSSGISATPITNAYNIAAEANTNQPKPQDAEVSVAMGMVKKPAELAPGSGLMV